MTNWPEYPIMMFTNGGVEIDRAANIESAISVLYGDLSGHDDNARLVFAPAEFTGGLRHHAHLNADCFNIPVDHVHTLPGHSQQLDSLEQIEKLLWRQIDLNSPEDIDSSLIAAINACRLVPGNASEPPYPRNYPSQALAGAFLANIFRDSACDEELTGEQVHDIMAAGSADQHFEPNTGGGIWLSHSLHATEEGLVHVVAGDDSVAVYKALAPTAEAASLAWYDRCGEEDDIKLAEYFWEADAPCPKP